MTDDGMNHPADRLAMVREKIKALQAQEDELKAALLAMEPEDRVGSFYEARVAPVARVALDTKALKAALGEEALAPYQKQTTANVVTVRSLEV